MEPVQIISLFLLGIAVALVWRFWYVVNKSVLTPEQKEKKEKLIGTFLTFMTIGLAVLQFFVAPAIENNTINEINTRVTNLQETVDVITNNGMIFTGPVDQVNVYGPQGGGNNQSSASAVEKTLPTTLDDIDTADSWPVGWSDSNGGRKAYTIEVIVSI